ncbi:LysR substrate-binding domain-containing protein [Caminibacter sp.]
MTLKELEIFYTLSKHNHMGKAAKELNITQSAVSLAIKSLEREIGEKLFERIGKKVVLNEYGRIFYKKTYPHFLALNESKNLFKKDKISGELNIASSKTYGNFTIPQIIINFLKKHQNVSIRHQIKNSTEIINLLKEGKIDLGIIESEIDEIDIIKEKIKTDRLIIVSSDKNLNKEYFIDELFNKKWLLREEGSGTRNMFLNALGELKKELPVFMVCNDFDEIKNYLKNDKEIITCISECAVKKEIKEGILIKVNVKNLNLKRNYYAVYHKNKYKSSLFNAFLNELKNIF